MKKLKELGEPEEHSMNNSSTFNQKKIAIDSPQRQVQPLNGSLVFIKISYKKGIKVKRKNVIIRAIAGSVATLIAAVLIGAAPIRLFAEGWTESGEGQCGHIPDNVNNSQFSCDNKQVGDNCQRLVVNADIYCRNSASQIAQCITEVFFNELSEPVPQPFGGTLLQGTCDANGNCSGMTSTSVTVMSDTRTKQGVNCDPPVGGDR